MEQPHSNQIAWSTGIISQRINNPETPLLWPPHAKSWLIEKDSDAGRNWGQEEKGMRWLDGITDSMDMSFFFFFQSLNGFIKGC